MDLIPTKIRQLRSTETVLIGQKDHGSVPMTIPIVFNRFDQALNFVISEILARTKFSIFSPNWHNCSFYDDWRRDFSHGFCHVFCPFESELFEERLFYELERR